MESFEKAVPLFNIVYIFSSNLSLFLFFSLFLSLFPCFFSASIYFKRDEDSIMELAFPECREQSSGLELALDNEPKRASGIRGDGGKEGRVCVKSTRDKIFRVSNPACRFPPGKKLSGGK